VLGPYPGCRASEAQLLLNLKGYNAFSLEDGVGGWWEAVMTPTSLRSESALPEGYLQAKALRDSDLWEHRRPGRSRRRPRQ
jgi:hypothetical protein